MNDPRIGTMEKLPALTVGGNPREPGNVVIGIGGKYVVALDYFGDQSALVEELKETVDAETAREETHDGGDHVASDAVLDTEKQRRRRRV